MNKRPAHPGIIDSLSNFSEWLCIKNTLLIYEWMRSEQYAILSPSRESICTNVIEVFQFVVQQCVLVSLVTPVLGYVNEIWIWIIWYIISFIGLCRYLVGKTKCYRTALLRHWPVSVYLVWFMTEGVAEFCSNVATVAHCARTHARQLRRRGYESWKSVVEYKPSADYWLNARLA